MSTNRNNHENSGKDNPSNSNEAATIDFGTRVICDQNFSKMVALPKVALQNMGKVSQVNVTLVQQGGEKFLKLTPVKGGKRN